jgi:RimJ/RimL family protein N-acetyltransferase
MGAGTWNLYVVKVPQLHTTRLHLRHLRLDDAVAIKAYRGLPEVAKYQSWTTFGLEDATQLIADQLTTKSAAADSWVQLMIVLRESSQPIGDCGIHFLSKAPQQVELGITLDPSYQNRGLATEAIEGVLSYVFDSLNMHRAMATTDVENYAAQNLFKRLGFRREAHFVEHLWFKGAFGSEYVYAMLRREWKVLANRHRSTR